MFPVFPSTNTWMEEKVDVSHYLLPKCWWADGSKAMLHSVPTLPSKLPRHRSSSFGQHKCAQKLTKLLDENMVQFQLLFCWHVTFWGIFVSRREKEPCVFEGYEPKLALFNSMAMERSQSEPLVGSSGGSNAFCSERVRNEIALEAARPCGLPTTFESPEVPMLPVHDGQTGKGRGNVVSRPSSFVTPPSKQPLHPERDLDRRQGERVGQRTEGQMPMPEGPPQSMGPVPSATGVTKATGSGVNTTGSGVGNDSMDLQRSLELELVNHLREQNSRLLAELEDLKRKTPNGSTSSWCEVDSKEPSGKNVGNVGQTGMRNGCSTPKRSVPAASGEMKEPRYTPGGARVPDGTPPQDVVTSPPPMPPPLPQFPGYAPDSKELNQFLDAYEKKVVHPMFKRSDKEWEPTKELSPSEARSFWLEQELRNCFFNYKIKINSSYVHSNMVYVQA